MLLEMEVEFPSKALPHEEGLDPVFLVVEAQVEVVAMEAQVGVVPKVAL